MRSPFDDRSYNAWRPGITTLSLGLVGIANIWTGWFSDWWLLLAIPMTLFGLAMIILGLTWARQP